MSTPATAVLQWPSVAPASKQLLQTSAQCSPHLRNSVSVEKWKDRKVDLWGIGTEIEVGMIWGSVKNLMKNSGGACPREFFPKFLTLPQIIPTSLAKQKGNILHKNCTWIQKVTFYKNCTVQFLSWRYFVQFLCYVTYFTPVCVASAFLFKKAGSWFLQNVYEQQKG